MPITTTHYRTTAEITTRIVTSKMIISWYYGNIILGQLTRFQDELFMTKMTIKAIRGVIYHVNIGRSSERNEHSILNYHIFFTNFSFADDECSSKNKFFELMVIRVNLYLIFFLSVLNDLKSIKNSTLMIIMKKSAWA